MSKYSRIKVDNEVINEFKAVLNKRLVAMLKDRISLILLGVEAFNTAAAEDKSQDDCLIVALDLTAVDEGSWIIGLDTFNGSIEDGQSVQEALERAINIALSASDDEESKESPKFISNTREYLKNVRAKTRSLLGNSWQTMKTVFGKDPEDQNDTEGGE